MKEIFTEEEYNEAVKKYNEKIKIDFYSNIWNKIYNFNDYILKNIQFVVLKRSGGF